jgi:hypothetical protein
VIALRSQAPRRHLDVSELISSAMDVPKVEAERLGGGRSWSAGGVDFRTESRSKRTPGGEGNE